MQKVRKLRFYHCQELKVHESDLAHCWGTQKIYFILSLKRCGPLEEACTDQELLV